MFYSFPVDIVSNKLASLEATLVETMTSSLTDGGEV